MNDLYTAKEVIVLGWDDPSTLTFFLPFATVTLGNAPGSPEVILRARTPLDRTSDIALTRWDQCDRVVNTGLSFIKDGRTLALVFATQTTQEEFLQHLNCATRFQNPSPNDQASKQATGIELKPCGRADDNTTMHKMTRAFRDLVANAIVPSDDENSVLPAGSRGLDVRTDTDEEVWEMV